MHWKNKISPQSIRRGVIFNRFFKHYTYVKPEVPEPPILLYAFWTFLYKKCNSYARASLQRNYFQLYNNFSCIKFSHFANSDLKNTIYWYIYIYIYICIKISKIKMSPVRFSMKSHHLLLNINYGIPEN